MDQLEQCPVCTLYLHNGMSLESHLDTHPKDQVIKALCSLSATRSNYGSRASTPLQSERSYRSRSRTPATDDITRWSSSINNTENERFWRRTPSRTPKATITHNNTPELRNIDSNYENVSMHNLNNEYNSYGRNDKIPQQYGNNLPIPEYNQPYTYVQDQKEENEIKFSRSAEYTSLNQANNIYAFNMPAATQSMKYQNTLMSSTSKRNNDVVNLMPANKKQNDFIKLLPQNNNIAVVKAKLGSVQYITPGVMITRPTYVQKSPQNLMMSTIQNSSSINQKKITPTPATLVPSNSITTATLTPNTTVVTQNSQLIYSEIHNIDGKGFLDDVTSVSVPDTVTNVSQTSSLYQNVMVFDQYGNSSCMYTTPNQLLPKPNKPNKKLMMEKSEANKTLVIEVSPINPPQTMDVCNASTSTSQSQLTENCLESAKFDKSDNCDTPSTKGLKIISNIKVEVPVQHHKNLLNTVVDLTGTTETEHPKSPESILPDLDVRNVNVKKLASNNSQTSLLNGEASSSSNTFSVIKNVGNPPSYKESKFDTKIHETESSDSFPVPDLICNEKPSISPCSELSDNCDNATAHTSLSPKPEPIQVHMEVIKETNIPIRTYKSNPLRLNNIFVKKNKKVLQIKNSKANPIASTSSTDLPLESQASHLSHSLRLPEDFTITKIHADKKKEEENLVVKLDTVSINKVVKKGEPNDFETDNEDQSMELEIEPVADSSYHSMPMSTIDLTQVKEEVNINEFSNQTAISDKEFSDLASLRPISVVAYENTADAFDEDSSNRELLDIEAASKSKHFVSMINDNYFGDNIYADYFTPDRVESFDPVREPGSHHVPKDDVYIWTESQKDNEFVLPNFIHDGYKGGESSGYLNTTEIEVVRREGEGCGDSKVDMMSESQSESEPLNICADEKMPPRGELSEQESNGDLDAWNGMYPEVNASEPYDLMARESWVSDGSDIDSNEKQENIEEEMPKPKVYSCEVCMQQFPQLKELRAHRLEVHPPASSSSVDDKTYSRIMTNRVIKKEEKPDEVVLAGMLQDTNSALTTSVLHIFDATEDKKIVIKTEEKRRRRDYICPTCKVDQLTDLAFHEHLKIHPLECLTCGKCFYRRTNLSLHIKTHLGIKNYKCEVCEKRFLTRQKLLEHHNVHTGRTPVKCTLCDATFRRYSNMVQHRDRHHLNKKPKVRDFVCQCGEVFHSRAKLRWHKETHDDKPKACQYCCDKFVHMSSLTRHVRRTHNSYFTRDDVHRRNENVSCPVCKQVYLRSNLKTHMRTHSGKRPYVCVICNKGFTTQWNLKLHRWTHMSRSAKPYKCTLCKGAFIRQAEYISHMNAHKSVRPYTCNYCGCQFIRKYNCQRHVREHEMAKKYVCKVPDCGKSFHRSYYLSEHMKVHSGARPFSCNICGKTSSNKSNHNKHIKIHHAREPVATEA